MMSDFKMNNRSMIPLRILLDSDLSANELRLYGLIESFSPQISDEELASQLNLSLSEIQQMKSHLIEKGIL